MEKRTLLAVVISFVILLGWAWLFPPPPPEKSAPPLPEEASSTRLDIQESPTVISRPEDLPASYQVQDVVPDLPSKEIIVETDYYRLVVDSRGGVVKSLQLKRHHRFKSRLSWATWFPSLRDMSFLKMIFGEDPPDGKEHNQVEMINRNLEGVQAHAVQFENNEEWSLLFRNASYASNVDNIKLNSEDEQKQLVLTSPVIGGIQLIKTFEIFSGTYVLNYKTQVINRSDFIQPLRIRHVFGEGRVPDTDSIERMTHIGPIYYYDGSVETEDTEDIEEEIQISSMEWLGLEDQYFIKAVSPMTPVKYGYFQALRSFNGEKTLEPYFGVRLPLVELQSNRQIEARFQIYYGPKEDLEMEKFGKDFPQAHHMTLESLAKPLLILLRGIYKYVHNYGVAIIILTILVRLVLFPLTYKGMKSMKKMQQLQPKMKKIQAKYKDNREKLNTEVMDLYKRHKVNPVGGCLPMLLQIPVFFALYSALMSAVELRHAPFYLWISDLSAPDGLGITPLLMGISMYLQQKMSPTAMDPTQAKIMGMLPIVFTIFTFTFPSGLTLYWVTSNVLSIGQQYLINRIKTTELEEHN